MKGHYLFLAGLLAGAAGGALFGVWHGRRTAPARIVEVVKEKPAAAPSGEASKSAGGAAPAAGRDDRKEGGLPLGRREEEPPKSVEGRPTVTSDSQALALLASGKPEERDAALAWLRDRLYGATAEEWAELDARLAAALAALPVEERARVLEDLFGADGFILDEAGPALREGRLRDLFLLTARDVPAGDARRMILRALSCQVMGERGTDLRDIFSLLEREPRHETSRLEAGAGKPFTDSATALLLEEMGAPGRLGLPVEEIEDLLGLVPLGSPGAGEAERAVLVSWATEHTDPRARSAALIVLGGVGTPEATGVLTGVANDARKPVSDRVMAYLALRRTGQEGKLSEPTRREILKLWEDSGKKEAEDFFED
ncbi:MAG: hypothetical protein HYY18_08140 [Planctomycetes bacterium]|nr:hypothetical protein [Planctomycetota bacterium]